MNSGENAPVVIVRENTNITSGLEVHEAIIRASSALAGILRGTLGPCGLDKGLYKASGEFAVTSDGARIINDLLIKNPGAKLLISLGKTQESAIGDGVTSTVILASALLEEAGRLLRKGVHPLVIVDGFQTSAKIAQQVILENSISIGIDDSERLREVALTALSGRSAGGFSQQYSQMLIDALQHVTEQTSDASSCNFEDILFDKTEEGDQSDSCLLKGVYWKQRIPLPAMVGIRHDVKVAIINTDLKIRELTRDSEIELSSAEDYDAFLSSHDEVISKLATTLLDSQADIFCCSGEVDRDLLHNLAEAGKVVIPDVDHKRLLHLARASRAQIVEQIDGLSPSDLGNAKVFEAHRRTPTDEVQDRITFDGCEGPLVTCLIGGSTGTEEVIRGLYDAVRATSLAIEDGKIISGGGSTHMLSSNAVLAAAEQIADRTRLGIEAYARAMESIPWILASNAGTDGLDAVLELRAASRSGKGSFGITKTGKVGRMDSVWEPSESLQHGFAAACETACALLRCDQLISARGD